MSAPVVVGVDFPVEDGPAVAWAESEALLRGVELRLVHGCGDADMREAHAHSLHTVRAQARQALGELADTVRERHPALKVSAEVLDATARGALAESTGAAGLLVVGTRGSGGFSGLLVGSTALHVAATADCTVVVVPGPDGANGHSAPGDVVVGVDAREPEDAVLRFAFAEAAGRELPLRVAHAWRYPLVSQGHAVPPVYEKGHVEAEEERLLAEVLTGWREEFASVAVHPDSARSAPAKHLVGLSAGASLVVVGRHGRPHGPVGRLGSVSQAVVQHSHCPVAVVPLT